MTTPKRALQIARLLDACQPWMTVNSVSIAELSLIIRHYAELSQKWQAVLDAEPVATVCGHSRPVPDGVSFSSKDWDRLYALPAGAKLIIKPAP